VDATTESVVTLNVADEAPEGTVWLAGTVAAFVLLLESATRAPPAGAAPVRRIVPEDGAGPTTLTGFRVRDERPAGVIVSAAVPVAPP
jgi:hypothetical protein